MSVSGRGGSKDAGGGCVGYYFLAKLPVSASVRIPSLTSRFNLARTPSTFFGSSSWPRASQTSLTRSGPVALVEGGEGAGVVRVIGQVRRDGREPVGKVGDGLAGDREVLHVHLGLPPCRPSTGRTATVRSWKPCNLSAGVPHFGHGTAMGQVCTDRRITSPLVRHAFNDQCRQPRRHRPHKGVDIAHTMPTISVTFRHHRLRDRAVDRTVPMDSRWPLHSC